MTRKLSAAGLFDTLEVDLWENEYTLRSITRSLGEKFDEVQKQATELDDESNGTSADAAGLMIDMIGLLLEPVNGARPANEVLTELWEQDKLGLDWLNAFSQSLGEEAQARRRPTSPTATRR